MSQATVSASGLVRVTVASGTRSVDLVLPGAVPVAELLPELARSVGLLDATTVHGGYRIVTAEGRHLASDTGLIIQGVEDGGHLTVTAGVDDKPPRVYDDVVEAMTDVVESDLKPWEPASGRRTALVAAAMLLALGAVALYLQNTTVLAGSAAVTVAVALVAAAIVLSRVQDEAEAAVAVALMSAGYAAVGALMLAQVADPGAAFFGLPLAAAGGGALGAGLVAVVGLDEGRALALPPVAVGAVLLAGGLLVDAFDLEPGVVLTVALVLVVLAGSIFPWLALGATSTRVEQMFSLADITAEPREIDAEQVGADARIAHEILVAISGTVGLLLVLVAPLSVQRGLAGTVLAVMCCLAVMLRTRQYRTGSEVLVGLGSGVLGLVAVGASLLVFHPEWRPTTAVVLAAAGGVLLAVTLLPGTPSLRRGRLGDVAESASLLLLLPLLVLASGLAGALG